MSENTMTTAELTQEAINWASDCLELSGSAKVSEERAMAYITANYPGGWAGFKAECGTYVTLNTVETYGTIWVCVDCIHHHANGECGSCHDDEHGHDEEPLSAIEAPFTVAMGMAHEEHAEDCETRIQGSQPDSYECDCETNTFSTSQCEGCRSYLHGERHAMTLFKEPTITQYRVTSPGANGVDFEQFFTDRSAALKHYEATPEATLWHGDETTRGKWAVSARKARKGEYSELRNALKFD